MMQQIIETQVKKVFKSLKKNEYITPYKLTKILNTNKYIYRILYKLQREGYFRKNNIQPEYCKPNKNYSTRYVKK